MLSIIGFILSISILVFIHEFGHYAVARLFKVHIEEFSIGFGKELFSWKDKNNTKWKISMLPLGGFVKMHGDLYNSKDKISFNPNKAFLSKPVYARFLIILAGPVFNYLLAIIILTGIFSCIGRNELLPIVSEVIKDSPAEHVQLLNGDKIIKAGNKKIEYFSDLQKAILLSANHSMDLIIEREGKLLNIAIIPIKKIISEDNNKTAVGYVGIIAKNHFIEVKLNIFSAFYQAVKNVFEISALSLKAVSQIIIGDRSSDELRGPLTIAQQSGKYLSYGIANFLLFLAMLSVNIGLVNLLPIPVLDGGHLMFLLYEQIFKNKVNSVLYGILIKIGIMMIIFLVVISVSNDIKSLIF